jgi:hypothetical protein
MIEVNENGLNEHLTEWIRTADKNGTCCGVSYIVDSHGEPQVQTVTFFGMLSSVSLGVESYVHCPVCDRHVTMFTVFSTSECETTRVNEAGNDG